MRKSVVLFALSTSSAFAASLGCGGQTPPAQQPESAPEPAAAKPSLQMHSELGSVDPEAVRQAFHQLDGAFMDCEKSGIDRVEVLSGGVKFFLRIGEDGSAKWAYLEDSEIGDRPTEKCLISVVMGARWPKPDGGDAEARYAMDLPLQATRPPNDWDADKVAPVLEAHKEAIEACKSGSSETFRGTMYVGRGGHVIAAGVSMSGRADQSADCLASVLTRLRGLPSPGSWPAKVSFGL